MRLAFGPPRLACLVVCLVAMAPVFSPASNLLARGSLLLLAVGGTALVAIWIGLFGSAYDSGATLGAWQPVPFSHAHHAGELGIDCRYCHTSVETSAAAGMPSTDVCANCHWQIWTNAEMLEPVRRSWREGTRLHWKRIYELPDFVYFEHSVHVTAGVSCVVCHGDVDRMPLVYQAVRHTMEWCLECHRNPWPRLDARPLLNAPVPREPVLVSAEAVPRIRTTGLTSCSTCHR